MRTNSDFLAMNRNGKPDVGRRDTINDQINTLMNRKQRINNKMKGLAQVLGDRDKINERDYNEFQQLNEELRDLKITEANLTYIRNML
jgi:uncharacterized coiled-coil DUF342 family protein